MRNVCFILLMAGVILPAVAEAQTVSENDLRGMVRDYREAHAGEIIEEFVDLLSLPNHSFDSEAILRNAAFIAGMLEKRGASVRIFDADYENPKNPIVYGEIIVPGARRTLMFYAHYDGQRVIPEKWTGSAPFTPVLRPGKLVGGTPDPKPIPFPGQGQPYDDDWRIYARSASDDKAQVAAVLNAVDAVRESGLSLENNIKFLFEGAEEEGSAHLREFIENNRDMLTADVVFICDGPVYPTGKPTLYFGNRGIQSLNITVYGPNTNLHSGHYGNWAPNPALKLCRLLAGMKKPDGTVLIEGFYDTVEPLGKREQAALRELPRLDEQLQETYGFSGPDGGGRSLNELINLPSLNIRWLESGMNRTIIPSRASVLMDIRLVKGNDGKVMADKVKHYIEMQGFHIVTEDPGHDIRMKYPDIVKFAAGEGTPASRTSMDLPVVQNVIAVLGKTFGGDLVLIPTLGGTIPTYLFTDILGLPAVGVPIANPDNNQHQYDENIRLGNFWRGIETMAALMVFVR